MEVRDRALDLGGERDVVVAEGGVPPAVRADGVQVHARDREALAIDQGAAQAGRAGRGQALGDGRHLGLERLALGVQSLDAIAQGLARPEGRIRGRPRGHRRARDGSIWGSAKQAARFR